MPSRYAPVFPTTTWTAIHAAQDCQSPESVEALNRCVAAYWKPVFYFLRARGMSLQRAEDLTQEFFLQFLERGWIRRADQERGRFRTFLLTILTRFLADRETDRAPRQKRFDDRLVLVSALMTETERAFEPFDRYPEQTPSARLLHPHLCLWLTGHVPVDPEHFCASRSRTREGYNSPKTDPL